jgi:2-dehydro-3-deoxyphosphogluconate aldolase / (4S)-4-hydroxy-2-oxoglutarate aldolase
MPLVNSKETVMESRLFSWERFLAVPVVGIIRNISAEDLGYIIPLYLEAGLTTIEITMNTPGAEKMIRYAVDRYGGQLNIGAGTVCNPEDLARALEAGAQFIVTPLTDERVISSCVQKNIAVFPGAFTPTEIYKAWELGAGMVKVFPATSFGPSYIKDLKGPLNQVSIMPTGGVTIHNCIDFLEAGATAVGMGGRLFDKNLLGKKDRIALSAGFESLVKNIKNWQMMSK